MRLGRSDAIALPGGCHCVPIDARLSSADANWLERGPVARRETSVGNSGGVRRAWFKGATVRVTLRACGQ